LSAFSATTQKKREKKPEEENNNQKKSVFQALLLRTSGHLLTSFFFDADPTVTWPEPIREMERGPMDAILSAQKQEIPMAAPSPGPTQTK
jgi:hypothetical protein